MAESHGDDVGSLVLNRATTTTSSTAASAATNSTSFNLRKSFSAAAVRRRILDAIRCGGSSLSRRQHRESNGSKIPEEKPSGEQEDTEPLPRRGARSEKLCDLLHLAEIHEKRENEAEARKKLEALEKLKQVVEDLQCDDCGNGERRKTAARDVRSMAKENSEARKTLAMLGAIPPLVGMLDCVDLDSQIAALYALLNIGIGNYIDEELIQRIGAVTALEARAAGINYTFAPCVAVVKDVRWNRCYESYSEDTDTVRKMTSIVTGLQGPPPPDYPKGYPFVAGRKNLIACAKHFVGDGGTEGGVNEGDARMGYEELERLHMAPYLDCISQNVCTVMASYSSYNGQKMHSHKFLLTDVLKNKLGFKGLVISDWRGIDKLIEQKESKAPDYRECAALGINAGIDMVLGPDDYVNFQKDLMSLVESGEVPTSRIDDAVQRILRVKFAAGIFEHPLADRSLLDVVSCELHREVAREAVRKSLVLLKNGKDPQRPFLPLYKNAGKILVAGTHADDLGYQCGAWSVSWPGGSGKTTEGTTILDAIKAAVGTETEVIYEQCPSTDTLSVHDFSFAIVAVGEPPYAEYMGSKTKLVIPSDVADVIDAVADRVPTLLILISGRPIEIKSQMLEKVEGLVAAWLPGTEGNGITDVVFGDYDFVGRLPVSWFKRLDQLPMDPGADSYDPLFPCGFGLTYKK